MLTAITDDLWHLPFTVTLPLGMKMPARMTVVRLRDSRLLLHSPAPIDQALAVELGRLGEVAILVAPNTQHQRFISAAAQAFPNARVLAAEGVAAKQPSLRIDGVLGNHAPPDYRDEIEQVLIEGAPALNEVAFFHRASRTLIACDLVFNILEPPNFMASLVLTLVGARGRLAQSRAWRFLAKDRPAVAASVERILRWDFERLVPAHGEIVEADARAALGAALAHWFPVENHPPAVGDHAIRPN
jgi:Domain of unknown function (DUF4336)